MLLVVKNASASGRGSLNDCPTNGNTGLASGAAAGFVKSRHFGCRLGIIVQNLGDLGLRGSPGLDRTAVIVVSDDILGVVQSLFGGNPTEKVLERINEPILDDRAGPVIEEVGLVVDFGALEVVNHSLVVLLVHLLKFLQRGGYLPLQAGGMEAHVVERFEVGIFG